MSADTSEARRAFAAAAAALAEKALLLRRDSTDLSSTTRAVLQELVARVNRTAALLGLLGGGDQSRRGASSASLAKRSERLLTPSRFPAGNYVVDASGALTPHCLRCRTTETGRWRPGPAGAQSLCNKCGLRERIATVGRPGKRRRIGERTRGTTSSVSSSSSASKARTTAAVAAAAAVTVATETTALTDSDTLSGGGGGGGGGGGRCGNDVEMRSRNIGSSSGCGGDDFTLSSKLGNDDGSRRSISRSSSRSTSSCSAAGDHGGCKAVGSNNSGIPGRMTACLLAIDHPRAGRKLRGGDSPGNAQDCTTASGIVRPAPAASAASDLSPPLRPLARDALDIPADLPHHPPRPGPVVDASLLGDMPLAMDHDAASGTAAVHVPSLQAMITDTFPDLGDGWAVHDPNSLDHIDSFSQR